MPSGLRPGTIASTLPVRTAAVIQEILGSADRAGAADDQPARTVSVLSNPEFLAEGTAIANLEAPDRVLIGGDDPQAIAALVAIDGQWVPAERILTTNLWSSELSKLTANAFLAHRKSSLPARSTASPPSVRPPERMCRRWPAPSGPTATTRCARSLRLRRKFLQAGPGFGGSCFQKDILNLVYLCRHYGLEEVAAYWEQVAAYWEQVVTLNHWQQQRNRFAEANGYARLVITRLFGTVSGKRIGVLGFAFKADTNDTRESPAIRICRDLLEEGAVLAIVDPKVSERQMARDLGQEPAGAEEGRWRRVVDVAQAAAGADALLLLTEWQQFAGIDWPAVAAVMRRPAWLFDARAKADAAAARAAGLQVWRVGEG